MDRFRIGHGPVEQSPATGVAFLVATDVAGRGIDVRGVQSVYNLGMPASRPRRYRQRPSQESVQRTSAPLDGSDGDARDGSASGDGGRSGGDGSGSDGDGGNHYHGHDRGRGCDADGVTEKRNAYREWYGLTYDHDPAAASNFMHRLGRTGRGGASGVTHTILVDQLSGSGPEGHGKNGNGKEADEEDRIDRAYGDSPVEVAHDACNLLLHLMVLSDQAEADCDRDGNSTGGNGEIGVVSTTSALQRHSYNILK